MLQIEEKNDEPRAALSRVGEKSDTRRRFLEAFERTCGNVSASCEYAGISRQTYYRWIKSLTPVNIRFRERLKLIRPDDRLVDLAESKLLQKIADGDITAIIFTLKARGRGRGWIERDKLESNNSRTEMRAKVMAGAEAFLLWLSEYPNASRSEREVMLNAFADRMKIDVDDLAEEVGFHMRKD
ncbi:MAG: hypothetical protein KF762_15230 [Acidobacteria bacterium]|nr:hypothetical protein [Acidobacteriota bacterium]